jgi:putative effector of murein hydrolase LrgA (UPF0299 family)
MKGITFAAAFILTVCIVIVGTVVYPNYLGQAVTSNNEYVFGFFLGTFLILLFFGWIGEKIARTIRKPRKKKQVNE